MERTAGESATARLVPSTTPGVPLPGRARHDLASVVLVVTVVAVVLVGAVAILAGVYANDRFTCPGVAWSIDYNGTDSGYFGTYPPTGCLGYPVAVASGYEISILLALTNSAASSHQVSSITVAAPSLLDSISPGLPLEVAPGESANVTLNVTIPTLTGDYVVAGTITTR